MADVFEARADLDQPRERLWALIEATPYLDWLLLTKRPEQVASRVLWGKRWPENVWLGTTAENQHWADRRIPVLLDHPAVVRFVSCEPLVGPVDLTRWLHGKEAARRVDWVIAGGESGHHARLMHPEWARSLRDQCRRTGVPFHFKQWGQWRPGSADDLGSSRYARWLDSPKGKIGFVRLGKHASGRELDGRTWDEFPLATTCQTSRVAAG